MIKAFIILEDDYDEIVKELQNISLEENRKIQKSCKNIVKRLTKITINDEIILRGTCQEGLDLVKAEREKIIDALIASNWRQNKAAQLLGLSPRVLNYKIKGHGITNSHWRKNKEKKNEEISEDNAFLDNKSNILKFDMCPR